MGTATHSRGGHPEVPAPHSSTTGNMDFNHKESSAKAWLRRSTNLVYQWEATVVHGRRVSIGRLIAVFAVLYHDDAPFLAAGKAAQARQGGPADC